MKRTLIPITLLALMLAASCSKQSPEAVDPGTATAGTSKYEPLSGFNTLQFNSGKMRKVKPEKDWICISVSENCHPEDVVAPGYMLSALDAAIAQGPSGVSSLFADENAASVYFPEWHTDWFSDVKSAILSGSYTFIKAGASTYLLGKADEVSESSYEYAVVYKVE